MTKKIAIVANATWNIYNFRLNVIRKLLDEGCEVVVMAPVDEYIFYKKDFPEVQHIPIRRLKRDSLNPVKDIQLTRELLGLYRKHKPDLVLHYTVKLNVYGGIAARIARIPSIAVVTGLGYPFIHNGFVRQVTKQLYRFSSRFHRKVVFENIDDRTLFVEEKLIRPEKGISVKGCGVNTKHYRPMPSDKNSKVIFSFIGRLLYDKGIREFVEAAHIVRNDHEHTEFWLIGEVDHENPAAVSEGDLVEWVRNSDIHYMGAQQDVRPFIAKSDCVVLPSYREAIARSLTEAMAMRKPVISTDTAGCREAIDDGVNGFLVPVGSATALAESMVRFLNLRPDERQRMGDAGREKAVEQFDDKRIAEDMYGIIAGVLGTESPPLRPQTTPHSPP